MRRFWPCLLVWLGACSTGPEWYAPPAQRKALEGAGDGRIARYIEMNAPNADAHLMRDISRYIEGGVWRWAGPHPQMRFFVESARHLRFSLDFAITESVFQQTGPMTLSFLVNGQPFDKSRHDRPGEYHYERQVPESMLRAGQENLVEIEPDRIWTSKEDGTQLSIILIRAGFVD
jgi:hypothetical protein